MKNSFNIGGAIIVIFFIIVSVLLITFVYNTTSNHKIENFGLLGRMMASRSRENRGSSAASRRSR